MRIGFSYWGFCENWGISKVVETPDGGRTARPILVREFLRSGHEIVGLQMQREQSPVVGMEFSDGFPEIDALLIEWRWKFWKNDVDHPDFLVERYEPDWDRQTELIYHYGGKVPIVIFDTTMKVSQDDEDWLNGVCEQRVVVVDPCVFPRKGHERQLYWTDYDFRMEPKFEYPNPPTYVYIGSNYERRRMFEKYYVDVARAWHGCVRVHGNWLTPSPERPDQTEFVKEAGKYIYFRRRNTMREAADLYSRSLAATHILKDHYNAIGLITPRFHEAVSFGCIGLVPVEFLLSRDFPEIFVVSSTEDVVDRLRLFACFTSDMRREYIDIQADVMRQTYPETRVSVAYKRFLRLFSEV